MSEYVRVILECLADISSGHTLKGANTIKAALRRAGLDETSLPDVLKDMEDRNEITRRSVEAVAGNGGETYVLDDERMVSSTHVHSHASDASAYAIADQGYARLAALQSVAADEHGQNGKDRGRQS